MNRDLALSDNCICHLIQCGGHRQLAEVLSAGAGDSVVYGEEERKILLTAKFDTHCRLQRSLKREIDVNSVTKQNQTALMISAWGNCRICLQLLIAYCRNVNVSDDSGVTALMFALSSRENESFLKILLDAGANVNHADKNGETVLMKAAASGQTTCVECLVKEGAEVDLTDSHGRTALMHAVLYDHVSCIVPLLQVKANFNAADNNGDTALMKSCAAGSLMCMFILIMEGASINAANAEGVTPLMVTAQKGTPACVRFLLEHGAGINAVDNIGRTALILALLNGSQECAMALIDAGACVNMASQDGTTALMTAAEVNAVTVLMRLIHLGAEIDQVDCQGRTALFIAAENRRLTCMNLLLNAGSDVHRCDITWRSVLMSAIYCSDSVLAHCDEKMRLICVKLLIEARVDVNAQDVEGNNALILAAGKPWCDTCFRDDNNSVLKTLIEATADINKQNNKGQTALMIACGHHHMNCASRLIEVGAEVNIRDNRGRTPIMYLAKGVGVRHLGLKEATQFIGMLLKSGAGINERDNDNMTPLALAIKRGNKHMPYSFLSMGSSVGKESSEDETMTVQALEGYRAGFLKLNEFLRNIREIWNPQLSTEFRRLYNTFVLFSPQHYSDLAFVDRHFIRFCICNCFTNFSLGMREYHFLNQRPVASPLFNALCYDSSGLEKYFLAICFVSVEDLQLLRRHHSTHVHPMNKCLVSEALCNPWPLVKLSFIVVSSLIGPGPQREQKIRQTELPWPIQECLMFQRPIASLPVHHWQDIPCSFNPAEYERLPAPSPLLFNWPFGRRLITCCCLYCRGRGMTFETT